MNEPELYFRLSHGRISLDQDMDDWGSDGPVFGPLSFVHTTYRDTIHLCFPSGIAHDLYVVEDCLYYDGVYYGDWSAFISDKSQRTERYQSSKASKALLPAKVLKDRPNQSRGVIDKWLADSLDGYWY